MSAKKTILAIIAVVMLCAICISGTLAYLAKNSGPVTNTFTFGGGLNDLALVEHVATATDGVYSLGTTTTSTGNNYDTVYPGVDIPKDPYVTVTGTGTTSGYLFIEVVEGTDFDSALGYSVRTGNWTETSLGAQHDGTVYVYALNDGKVTSVTDPIYILTDNKITIAADADLSNVSGDTLTFYAYLLQTSGFDNYTAAWEAVFPTAPTP